ncbi:MAG: DNA polymerase III subunit gamma/tau [bacterium]|nr:DNA polymerase III subunit gamma/tau [bacterium]
MQANAASSGEYQVVARRYRPQAFDELIGQRQVSQALSNAIATGRVGHAYLFTGARGVGKTSCARVLAKSLNCLKGPTDQPCGECEICLSIAAGEDMDVLEIDGASNRGIDEIRELRSNVNKRPSRSRFRVYIIDEVHMLTPAAFNALLKTLEEPPEHVKFVFCTTDPEKIPITVLSRCQRFDFAPIETDAIHQRLAEIAANEGLEAEPEALRMLARRANGSMRDSQSLLEQLFSFCDAKISVADVNAMLGSADAGRLAELTQQLINRQAAEALATVDLSISEGVDAGQLAEQLLGYFRDMMAAKVGCSGELFLYAPEDEHGRLKQLADQAGMHSLLAMLEILDHAVSRMRQSVHGRTLLEIAIVQVSQLEDLDQLTDLISQVRGGGAVAPAQRPSSPPTPQPAQPAPTSAGEKKNETPLADAPPQPNTPETRLRLTAQSASSIWKQVVNAVEDTVAVDAGFAHRVATSGPNHLAVSFEGQYTLQKERCERGFHRSELETALSKLTGDTVRLEFVLLPEAAKAEVKASPKPNRRTMMRDAEQHPIVSEVMEMFQGEVIKVDAPRS